MSDHQFEAAWSSYRESRGPGPSPLIAKRLGELACRWLERLSDDPERVFEAFADDERETAWRGSVVDRRVELCNEHQCGRDVNSDVLNALMDEWRLVWADPCPPFTWPWFDKDRLWRALNVDRGALRDFDKATKLTPQIDILLESVASESPSARHRRELHAAMADQDEPLIAQALLEGVRMSTAGAGMAVILAAALRAWFAINESPRAFPSPSRASLARSLDGFLSRHAHSLPEEVHDLADEIRAGSTSEDQEVARLLLKAVRAARASMATGFRPEHPHFVSPIGSTPSQPTPSQPTPSQPTPSQPTPSQPTPSQPTPSQPTPSLPIDPAMRDLSRLSDGTWRITFGGEQVAGIADSVGLERLATILRASPLPVRASSLLTTTTSSLDAQEADEDDVRRDGVSDYEDELRQEAGEIEGKLHELSDDGHDVVDRRGRSRRVNGSEEAANERDVLRTRLEEIARALKNPHRVRRRPDTAVSNSIKRALARLGQCGSAAGSVVTYLTNHLNYGTEIIYSGDPWTVDLAPKATPVQ